MLLQQTPFLWLHGVFHLRGAHQDTPPPNCHVSKFPYFSGFLRDDAGLQNPAKKAGYFLGVLKRGRF